MARVPVANDPVAPRPIDPGYQRIDAPAAAFGALQARGAIQAGQDLAGIGDQVARRALVEQQFDNERELKKADVTLADKIRVITYGDGTEANRGYYSLQGEDAIAQAKPTLDAIAKAQEEVTATLPNERTRQIFAEAGRARVVSEQSVVGRHLDTQRRKANDAASLARVDAAVSDAATRWNEPDQLLKSRAIVANEVRDFADRNGLGTDAAEALLREQNAKLLGNVIQSAGRVNASEAQKIFDANKDWLPGTALAAIEREMKTNLEFERRRQEHEIIMQEKAQAKAATAAYDKYITPAIDPQNPNGIDLHAAANDPALAAHPQLKVALFNFQAALDKGEAPARVSAETFGQLYPLTHLPDGDPRKITDPRQLDEYVAARKLNLTHLKALREEIADETDPKVGSFGATAKALIIAGAKQIQGSTAGGLPNPDGALDAARYTLDVTNMLRAAREKGEDLRPYFDINSPKYIASADLLKDYKRSMQDRLRKITESMNQPTGGAVVPKAPGAPAVEYKSLSDLQKAVKEKKVSREDGVRIAKEKGWIE